MNIVADHVSTLVQFQSLTETTLRPVSNGLDNEKYWRYFSKFPNEFAKGLALALHPEQEFVSYNQMNPLQKEQESICRQIDDIMKNRLRRFKFLLKKGRNEDAMAIADEFYEWMFLQDRDDNEEINYFREDELQMYLDD